MIPFDTIVEQGSNENGKYIKWSGGTMICSNTKNYEITTFQNAGTALFYGYLELGDFLVSFINIPDITYSHHDSSSVICLQPYGTIGGVSKTSPGGVYPISFAKIIEPTSIAITYIAIGKWK